MKLSKKVIVTVISTLVLISGGVVYAINTSTTREASEGVVTNQKTKPVTTSYSSKYQKFSGFNVSLCNSEELLALKDPRNKVLVMAGIHCDVDIDDIQPQEFLNNCYYFGFCVSTKPIADKFIENYWNTNKLYEKNFEKSEAYANKIIAGYSSLIPIVDKGSYYVACFSLDQNGNISGIDIYPEPINVK